MERHGDKAAEQAKAAVGVVGVVGDVKTEEEGEAVFDIVSSAGVFVILGLVHVEVFRDWCEHDTAVEAEVGDVDWYRFGGTDGLDAEDGDISAVIGDGGYATEHGNCGIPSNCVGPAEICKTFVRRL